MVLVFLLSRSVRFEPDCLTAWERTLVSVEVHTDDHYAIERVIKAVLTPVNSPWYRRTEVNSEERFGSRCTPQVGFSSSPIFFALLIHGNVGLL